MALFFIKLPQQGFVKALVHIAHVKYHAEFLIVFLLKMLPKGAALIYFGLHVSESTFHFFSPEGLFTVSLRAGN